MKLIINITIYLLFLPVLAQASAIDIPAGNIVEETAFFQYAIYLIEPLKDEPKELSGKILKDNYPGLKMTDKPEAKENSIRIRVNDTVQKNYRPPETESLKYFGKGLSPVQAEKLRSVSSAIIMDFAIPAQNISTGLYEASRYIADVAKTTKGVIWDEETRQCFGYDTWNALRIESFKNGLPDVSKQITIHAYKNNDYIRAITLGMGKFGLPDIEVSDFTWSENRSVGNLINLVAQLMYETGTIFKTGEFHINVDTIQHKRIKKETKESLFENAEKEVTIRIVKGVQDEGDPFNRIMEIIFVNYPGKDKREQMRVMLSKLWGWKDELTYVEHNEAIIAASDRAKKRLPAIREKIQKGLAPGEYYLLKAPFKTPDGGNEWMWVEVVSWDRADEIKGLLNNQPHNIPTLNAGSNVTIHPDVVFDYIHRLPDGTSEGNETQALIEKFSRQN